MAYTLFEPQAQVVQAETAKTLKIYDQSSWSGESLNTTSCKLVIVRVDDDGTRKTFDDYLLISATGDTTKFLEYLSSSGHEVNIEDLTIGGISVGDYFSDGYYEITVVYSDGTYEVGSEPYYECICAFLARYKCMKRTMPAKILSWPITDEVKRKNQDIYSIGLYLDAAEHAASLGQYTEFKKFVAVIEKIFDSYSIPEPW